jgi:c-di-GMP-related signal transduction protein
MERLRKITKNLSPGRRCSGRCLNRGPPEKKSETLELEQVFSVINDTIPTTIVSLYRKMIMKSEICKYMKGGRSQLEGLVSVFER